MDWSHWPRQIGIVILIVGSFWPSLYYGTLSSYHNRTSPEKWLPGFREEPLLQVGYIALITSLGVCGSADTGGHGNKLNSLLLFAHVDAAYVSLPLLNSLAVVDVSTITSDCAGSFAPYTGSDLASDLDLYRPRAFRSFAHRSPDRLQGFGMGDERGRTGGTSGWWALVCCITCTKKKKMVLTARTIQSYILGAVL